MTTAQIYVSARDGEKNSVIYKTADGAEFLHSGGSRAWRNHNPGNLVSSEKSGLAIGKGGRFAAFPDHDTGVKALKHTLKKGYSELKLNEVFQKYAPSTDNNNPEHYIAQVKKLTGLDADRKLGDLNDEELGKFMKAIEKVEGWIVGKVEAIPHAQQFEVKGVDAKPVSNMDYVINFFTKSGAEETVKGTTDKDGKTAVIKTDVKSPVKLTLPRPDPGHPLKSSKDKKKPAGKQVVAAEVKAKPWYDFVFSTAHASEDKRDDIWAAAAAGGVAGAKAGGGTATGAKSTASAAGTGAATTTATTTATATATTGAAAATPAAPVAVVKQAGAIQASGTKKKSEKYVEPVLKEAGVFVSWVFDTSAGSGKVLNGLPYMIVKIEGGKAVPVMEGQKVQLMRDNVIRKKVPFGTEVALFLGSDAKEKYRNKVMYQVTAEEGLTDVTVKIAETEGTVYDASEETPNTPVVTGTKKKFSAKLYGTTWMNFSHKFTEAEAGELTTEAVAEVQTAVKQIYHGDPTVAATKISLVVNKPNGKTMKIIWPISAFDNCRHNIPAITGLQAAKDDILPRVNPNTYQAFIQAAFDMDVEELEINSGWRPMLGSVLHRIGVGLDVGVIKVNGTPRTYRRSASVAERDYKESVKQRKKLDEKIKKKTATPEQIELRDKMVAEEPAKLKLASDSITNSYPADLKTFSAKLRGNTEVRQTFDPWEMEDNTRDDKAATQNDLTDGNETLHATHLHITVFDAELGHG